MKLKSLTAAEYLARLEAYFKRLPSHHRHTPLFKLACAAIRAGRAQDADALAAYLEEVYRAAVGGEPDDDQRADCASTAVNALARLGEEEADDEEAQKRRERGRPFKIPEAETAAWRKWMAGILAATPDLAVDEAVADRAWTDEAKRVELRDAALKALVPALPAGSWLFYGGKRADKSRLAYLDERLKPTVWGEELWCPNPLGKPERLKENCRRIDYLVLEIDEELAPLPEFAGDPECEDPAHGAAMADQQQKFWRRILDDGLLPVRCITYSGGKSLHALIPIAGASREELEGIRGRLKRAYMRLHFDPATLDAVRKTRVPWGVRWRATGEAGMSCYLLQECLCLNKDAPALSLEDFAGRLEAIIAKFAGPPTGFADALERHKHLSIDEISLRSYLEWKGAELWTDAITREQYFSGFDTEDINLLKVIIRNDWKRTDGKILPFEQIQSNIDLVFDRNRKNPLMEWIRSRPWDGKDRLPAIYAVLGIAGDALSETLVRKWLVQTAAILHNGEDGHFYGTDGVLTLQGPQGLGKTSFFRLLVPEYPENNWFEGGMSIDTRDKDNLIELTSRWILELGEADGTTKKEQAQLKAKLTAEKDTIRHPFDRAPITTPRHCSVCASVNKDDYLHDETGNRRWWTVPISRLDLAKMPDIQQLWAQMEDIWQRADQKSQTCFRLTREEQAALAERNSAVTTDAGFEDELLKAFPTIKSPAANAFKPMTLMEICDAALGADKSYTRADKVAMRKTLEKLGIRRKTVRGIRLFDVPMAIALPPETQFPGCGDSPF